MMSSGLISTAKNGHDYPEESNPQAASGDKGAFQ
jgi:hypothetical protein